MSRPLPLIPAVQHYAWGGYDFIPQLLGIANPDHKPYAELWMGAHPRGVARLRLDGAQPAVPEWLAEDPAGRLGQDVVRQFGPQLPFLFKVLDVRRMLSIQAHPNKAQAEAGFARENAAGVPVDAPHRNFKDDNHKPEVMVALTDFWLLHGFRPGSEIKRMLTEVREFRALTPHFDGSDIKKLYAFVMSLPQPEVDRLLHPLRERLTAEAPRDKDQPDYWALEAFRDYDSAEGHSDRGIFSIYLLNLVRLAPGEGIFQAAGVPHAYLEGVNMELMANSDNVFRGGLTPKHMDPEALMHHLVFESVDPQILTGERLSSAEVTYPTPAPDFVLSRVDIRSKESYRCGPSRGPEVLIVTEGEVLIDEQLKMPRGDAFFVPHGVAYTITGQESENQLFRAAVPV